MCDEADCCLLGCLCCWCAADAAEDERRRQEYCNARPVYVQPVVVTAAAYPTTASPAGYYTAYPSAYSPAQAAAYPYEGTYPPPATATGTYPSSTYASYPKTS